MMHRWKKLNRGLLLGAVLLVGFVVFVIAQNAQFQKSVPDIRELSQDYVAAMMDLNVLPDGAMTEDFYLTSQAQEQKLSEMDDILNTFWNAQTKQESLNGVSGDKMRQQYQEALAREQFSRVLAIEFNLSDKDIEVNSDGPNRAKVSLFTDDLIVTHTGDEGQCLFFVNTWGINEIEDMYEKDNPMENSAQRKSTYRLNMDLELELVKGEWKIISCQSNYWISSTTVVLDEQGTAGGEAHE